MGKPLESHIKFACWILEIIAEEKNRELEKEDNEEDDIIGRMTRAHI